MRIFSVAVPVLLLALGGCGAETGAGEPEAGIIEGHIRLGPIMPVCREGVPCDGVYKGAKVTVTANGVSVERVTANDNGDFRAEVAPGAYEVGVEVAGPMPRCTPQQVVAKAGETVRVQIDCDSGIR